MHPFIQATQAAVDRYKRCTEIIHEAGVAVESVSAKVLDDSDEKGILFTVKNGDLNLAWMFFHGGDPRRFGDIGIKLFFDGYNEGDSVFLDFDQCWNTVKQNLDTVIRSDDFCTASLYDEFTITSDHLSAKTELKIKVKIAIGETGKGSNAEDLPLADAESLLHKMTTAFVEYNPS